jgi:hypothetical protein
VIVAEDPPPTNDNGAQEETPARQDVDVLLDVSELEVDRIKLTVKDLRAHISVLAELASLLYLQVGLDDVRAILKEALQTVAEHPEILRILTRALDELVTGRLGMPLARWRMSLGAWRRAARSMSC